MSYNHQFVQLADKVVKRYIKTTNKAITGFRSDPNRPENKIDWLLSSPNDSFEVVWNDGEDVQIIRKNFTYDDEVLELYDLTEIVSFSRWNRGLLEHGILVEYEQPAPEIDTSNMLTDAEVNDIAATKNILALRKRLSTITSKEGIDRILTAAEKLDRPISVAKAIQDRKRELQQQ